MPTKEKIRRRCEDIANESNTRFDDTWKAICRDWLAANPPEPAEKPMTVRVRAACAINERGEYFIEGGSDLGDGFIVQEVRGNVLDDCAVNVHFLEADIPAPIPRTIQATVLQSPCVFLRIPTPEQL